MVKLSFHGAAETVTGSKYLLEADNARVLVDCGLFQGLKELRQRNWNKLPFLPQSVQAVVLTHAHVDHIGYLPRFVKDGFRGPIICTAATAELAELLLLDCARNQEDDSDYANRKGFSKHKPARPLYDLNDASQAIRQLKPISDSKREDWFSPAAPIFMRYHDAGHLLGSESIEVEIRNRPKPLRILFSGDVGRYNAPLYHDPKPPPACDYLVCESTYGDRDHPPEQILDQLCEVVKAGIRRGGVILMAAFAVGRSQQLIYLLRVLIEQNRIPELPIFLDSPMAADATNIYCEHSDQHDLSEGQLSGESCVLRGRNLHLARSASESKNINSVRGPAVIIASSGMMTGGRILHHLIQRLPDPRNTLILAGFQSEGTRGRAIQDGAKTVRIYGQDVQVRAATARMSALSGHADRTELLRWLKDLPAPKRVFITHGELASANHFAEELKQTKGWNTLVPKMEQCVELD